MEGKVTSPRRGWRQSQKVQAPEATLRISLGMQPIISGACLQFANRTVLSASKAKDIPPFSSSTVVTDYSSISRGFNCAGKPRSQGGCSQDHFRYLAYRKTGIRRGMSGLREIAETSPARLPVPWASSDVTLCTGTQGARSCVCKMLSCRHTHGRDLHVVHTTAPTSQRPVQTPRGLFSRSCSSSVSV